jgi:anti-sigma regulatory factor (Ser/Thr protein kinase)
MRRVLLVGDKGEVSDGFERAPLPADCVVERCESNLEAVGLIRSRAFEVVVTHPGTPLQDDLPLAVQLLAARPGVRIIILAPAITPEQIIDALRAHVFACFASPYDPVEIASMVGRAVEETAWQDGIEVVSGLPHWVTLRVACRLLTAERLVRFMTEYRSDVPDADRDLLMVAFREMLLNAMEHGAGFDAEKVVEVSAARTGRAIVYHFRDPGAGFDRASLPETLPQQPDELIAYYEARAKQGKRPGGFGMLIVKQIVDELVFNERGNEVLLIKYIA